MIMNMKKNLFVFICLFLLTSFSRGQDNQLFVLTCEDVAENCAVLFAHYYKAGNMDSVAIVMDYWEEKCGNTEQIQRAQILFAIDQKRYRDAVLKPGILENVLDYKEKENTSDPKKNPDDFDIFTKQLADSIMNRYSKLGISYAWCEFYGKNPDRLLKRIQNHEFDESALSQEYFSEVSKLKLNGNFNMAVFVGAWIPFEKLSELGPHPEVGYSVGGNIARFNFDANVGHRSLHTYETDILYRNTIIKTDRFSGYFLGIDIGVSVLRKQQNELLCIGGLGYEYFNVVHNKEIPTIESNYLNFGIAYRRYLQHNAYLGIQLKYNMMHYFSGSAFDNVENVFLTRVFLGWMSGGKKARELNRLQYEYK
jgi:hypothetical protein